MSKLTKSLAQFSENDVKALDRVLKKFTEYKKQSGSFYQEHLKSGAPDISEEYVAYTPILSFALIKSQAVMEKLTRWIIFLTVVLAVLAGIQVWLIVKSFLPILSSDLSSASPKSFDVISSTTAHCFRN